MSSKDLAVSVRGLSKSYTILHNAEKHTTMGEAMLHRIKNPLQRLEKETFWALRDVEFDIEKGNVVGIIGRNGAGKSTLLKILSQITEPTKGEITLYGRVGSLLEVGTGFHPELTGRENIFLNGAILGMRRSEIERQFDAIVDFAEVEQFLDTPVKRYSSGMYVRLAFAVAAHLNPEILVVDEVLAVGDAQFQKKCLGKMQDVAQHEGRTVLFVSHNMAAVQTLCSSAVLLKQGSVSRIGETDQVLNDYLREQKAAVVQFDDPEQLNQRWGDGRARFTKIYLTDVSGNLIGEIPFGSTFFICGQILNKTQGKARLSVAFAIAKAGGDVIFASHHDDEESNQTFTAETLEWKASLTPNVLKPGFYSLYVGITDDEWNSVDYVPDCTMFEVLSVADTASVNRLDTRPGVILPPKVTWEVVES